MSSKLASTLALCALSAGLAAGCNDRNNNNNPPPSAPASAAPAAQALGFNATLSGDQRVPPVTTAATGQAVVTVSADRSTINVQARTAGLSEVTKFHLHLGACGDTGPHLFNLLDKAPFSDTLNVDLTAADINPAPGLSFDEAVAAVLAGNTYLKPHTAAFPDGEIRGQVGAVKLAVSSITGEQEIPASSSLASGQGSIAINGAQDRIDLSFQTLGLTGVTKVHLHLGGCGEEGPVLFNLLEKAPYSPSFTAAVTAADLKPFSGLSFAGAIDALLSGRTYFKVHTAAFPAGEIRGQVGASTLKAGSLTPGQVVTTTSSSALGFGSISITGDQQTAILRLNSSGLADVTKVHLHLGKPGEAGPVLFNMLETIPFADSLSLRVSNNELKPFSGLSFAEACGKIFAGCTYFKVHTTPEPDGEIRGQLGPVVMAATLDGSQTVPAVTTAANGSAFVVLNGLQDSFSVVLETENLSDVQGVIIGEGLVGQSGPTLFDIVGAGGFSSSLDTRLPLSGLRATAQTPDAPAAIESFILGELYLNIPTTFAANGEIRGQIILP